MWITSTYLKSIHWLKGWETKEGKQVFNSLCHTATNPGKKIPPEASAPSAFPPNLRWQKGMGKSRFPAGKMHLHRWAVTPSSSVKCIPLKKGKKWASRLSNLEAGKAASRELPFSASSQPPRIPGRTFPSFPSHPLPPKRCPKRRAARSLRRSPTPKCSAGSQADTKPSLAGETGQCSSRAAFLEH